MTILLDGALQSGESEIGAPDERNFRFLSPSRLSYRICIFFYISSTEITAEKEVAREGTRYTFHSRSQRDDAKGRNCIKREFQEKVPWDHILAAHC